MREFSEHAADGEWGGGWRGEEGRERQWGGEVSGVCEAVGGCGCGGEEGGVGEGGYLGGCEGGMWVGGEETTVVAVPGVLRYLDVELSAMGVKMKFNIEP